MRLGSGPFPGGCARLTPIWHPSPNVGPRRDGLIPEFVVLHYTAMERAKAALERLSDPKAEVSAHYLIGADGTLWQLVEEEVRAWHAGMGSWRGFDDINSRSIGIELDNRGDHPFPDPQIMVLEYLLADILNRWQIPPKGVIGHSDMAPGRKRDPGPRFDWQRLEIQGLAAPRGVGPSPQRLDAARFRALAQDCGYTAPVDDIALRDAVRLRFRPWATGPLHPDDATPLLI